MVKSQSVSRSFIVSEVEAIRSLCRGLKIKKMRG